MDYSEDKAKKLKHMPILRVMNMLGMVAWRAGQCHTYGANNEYTCCEAEQKIRMLHPLSWVWFVVMILVSVIVQGVPDTVNEVKDTVRREAVWW